MVIQLIKNQRFNLKSTISFILLHFFFVAQYSLKYIINSMVYEYGNCSVQCYSTMVSNTITVYMVPPQYGFIRIYIDPKFKSRVYFICVPFVKTIVEM